MIARLTQAALFIVFTTSMFVFRLAEWAFQMDHTTSNILGIIATSSIFLYIMVAIFERILTVFIPNKSLFQKKIANVSNL